MHNLTNHRSKAPADQDATDDYKGDRFYGFAKAAGSRRKSNHQSVSASLNFKDTKLLEVMDEDSFLPYSAKRNERIRKDVSLFYHNKVHDGERKADSAVNKDVFK